MAPPRGKPFATVMVVLVEGSGVEEVETEKVEVFVGEEVLEVPLLRLEGGSKVIVEPHRHEGVFLAKQKGGILLTRNLVPGETVYNEKRIIAQKPGAKVLYLGAASGTSVSHVSDIVGPLEVILLFPSRPIVPATAVFESEVNKLKADQFKPFEQVTLEPYERDHACVIGGYRMPKKKKVAE
ncbi:hypothetical protein TSUD_51690 [Trifolium subterraneum]|uniref:Fibrillarin n=1 Tax=Trifolium subterraneum TaxID=3900 RepID=A0A2Z6M7A5_TRISU|nr:hypothetical protein TSUD_51690 [Trifolium subterraneum]